jgi:hypothetical protein
MVRRAFQAGGGVTTDRDEEVAAKPAVAGGQTGDAPLRDACSWTVVQAVEAVGGAVTALVVGVALLLL